MAEMSLENFVSKGSYGEPPPLANFFFFFFSSEYNKNWDR